MTFEQLVPLLATKGITIEKVNTKFSLTDRLGNSALWTLGDIKHYIIDGEFDVLCRPICKPAPHDPHRFIPDDSLDFDTAYQWIMNDKVIELLPYFHISTPRTVEGFMRCLALNSGFDLLGNDASFNEILKDFASKMILSKYPETVKIVYLQVKYYFELFSSNSQIEILTNDE
jgi:hypothetical protein